MVRFKQFIRKFPLIKRTFLFLALLSMLILTMGAQAQSSVRLEFLNVELWSEYDQPSMLVINEFAVSPNIVLPAEVKWRFPGAANLVAVAYENDGFLLNSPFEISAEQSDWQTISLNVDTYDTYHIEYYQPLIREGRNRVFDFQWIGDYSVNELRLSVSLPDDSMNVVTTPELSHLEIQADQGLLFGIVSKSGLMMGNSYRFNLQYARDSDTLTDPNQANQVNPSEPLDTETEGRVSINNLPWIIGGIGIALIAIALSLYWRSSQTTTTSSIRSRFRRREGASKKDSGEPIYCHECGTRSIPGDRFCRTCGSRLRAS